MKAIAAVALGIFLFISPAFAQLQQGTVVGSLAAPDGSPVARAEVTLFDQLGNPVTTVQANDGQFRIANVAVGSYSLKAVAPPFEAVVPCLPVVEPGPVAPHEKLPAAIAEQVNVTAEASQPATTTTRTTL